MAYKDRDDSLTLIGVLGDPRHRRAAPKSLRPSDQLPGYHPYKMPGLGIVYTTRAIDETVDVLLAGRGLRRAA